VRGENWRGCGRLKEGDRRSVDEGYEKGRSVRGSCCT
jgi:hypothetical protein